MNIFLPFIIALLTTLCVTPLVSRFAKQFNLTDNPKTRYHPAHTHTGIIPRAGGLSIYLGLAVAVLIYMPISKLYAGMLLAMTLLVVVGLIDDHQDIHPYFRLATNAVAAAVIVMAGAGIPYITNPITGGIIHLDTWRLTISFLGVHSILVWADVLAFGWILWTMNIVGWSAGVDGQMPGFVAIAALTLGLLSLRFTLKDPSQNAVTTLAFIVTGAFVGFIPWNFYPQKIMPGYGGKTLAGFLLAILGILSYGKLGTALLVLGIPMTDALYTLLRRLGTKKSPVWGDRGHLHHRLLEMGWGRRRVALFYWGVSAILGVIALSVNSRQKVFALLAVAVGLAAFLLWVRFFTQFSKPQDPDNG
jgi:UDP-GlcNAc:undecaprenyl-phosphate GlcNAc-1-phosphate transferase